MANACPSEEDVACFIEGRASATTARSILEHLDSCTECRILLASSLRGFETMPSAGTAGGFPRTFGVGAVIGGRYRIDRFIARGGMGEVYAAWDLELDEAVALKTIACTGLDSAGLAVRLRAEVQLARRVTHPNVCRILEFGVHRRRYREQDESIPFFTMELLSGETLAAYIARKGRLPECDAIRIASQVLGGLDAIHSAGIVHRDLKPQNVFIEPALKAEPRAIVMDFGLARRADAADSSVSSTGGGPAGTPAYMAPEQGLGVTPAPAWDIYAFGVLLFELLSGKLPFSVQTDAGHPARFSEPAPPLSSVLTGVHPGLEAIVARCLEREPSRRFASTAEVRHALSVIRRGRFSGRSSRALFPLAALVVSGLLAWWLTPSPRASLPAAPASNVLQADLGTVRLKQSAGPLPPPAQPSASSSSPVTADRSQLRGQNPARARSPGPRGRTVTPLTPGGQLSSGEPPRARPQAPGGATQAPIRQSLPAQTSVPPPEAGDDELAIPSFVPSSAVREDAKP